MRTREAILGLAMAVSLSMSLAACSGDDDGGNAEPKPSGPVSEITVDCDTYADTAKAIIAAIK